MPFKPDTLPAQIAAARHQERQLSGAPPTAFNSGAAQRAKESSARWSKAGVRDPQVDAAPPWFAGSRPFSETRFANARNFEDWKDRFLNETDMGYAFAPPPPEPALVPGPASPDQKTGVA